MAEDLDNIRVNVYKEELHCATNMERIACDGRNLMERPDSIIVREEAFTSETMPAMRHFVRKQRKVG